MLVSISSDAHVHYHIIMENSIGNFPTLVFFHAARNYFFLSSYGTPSFVRSCSGDSLCTLEQNIADTFYMAATGEGKFRKIFFVKFSEIFRFFMQYSCRSAAAWYGSMITQHCWMHYWKIRPRTWRVIEKNLILCSCVQQLSVDSLTKIRY